MNKRIIPAHKILEQNTNSRREKKWRSQMRSKMKKIEKQALGLE
jgi:hypothetical protein